MYLTQEEFIVLSARKMGIYATSEICQKFNISETAIKFADNALCKKYGISVKSAVNAKQKLVEIADIKQVKVVDRDKIPYYEYELISGHKNIYTLVKKLKITKKDVLALNNYFKSVEDENKQYELILDEDFFGMYRFLQVKEPDTNNKIDLTEELY